MVDRQVSRHVQRVGFNRGQPHESPLSSPPLATAPASQKQRETALWLCLYFPQLAIDALILNASRPVAAVEKNAGRLIIQCCNQAAAKAGIAEDMTLSAALSLCAELDVRHRDRHAEQRRLNQLANQVFRFSSQVSVYSTDAIVLEIKGSVRLFGGVKALTEQLNKQLSSAGYHYFTSIAPTPRAAFWLARQRITKPVTEEEALRAALRDLPVALLAADKKQLSRLQRCGIQTLADLMRLPRDGVIRRFGATILRTLNQALGHEAEPLKFFTPEQKFVDSYSFYLPTHDLDLIKPAAAKLLKQLESYLTERQAATQHFQCLLAHETSPTTVINVGCSHCSRQARHLLCLLEEHLQRLQLSAAVVEISIHCDQMETFLSNQFDLFELTLTDNQSWRQLLEQFEARLGTHALRRLSVRADHRPEKTCANAVQPNLAETCKDLIRPLWLMIHAEALKGSQNGPLWSGVLSFDDQPERIEQGWWDGQDICRDYYIAHNPQGSKLWIYFDRRRKGWFLHGLFA